MSCETPDPMQNVIDVDPNIRRNQPATSVEHSSGWRGKAAKILAVAALMTSGMVVAEAVHPKAAMAADSDTYSWSGATPLDEATDDYGYSTCPSNDSGCKNYSGLLYTIGGTTYGEADPWGYALRNCTSYVAEKISQEFGGRNISGWGNAANWAVAAQDAGYTLDSSPEVGDIAVWGTEVGGGYGHVAYVASVSSGVATFGEYNVAETGAYTNSYTSTDHPGGQVYPDWYIHMGTPTDSESESFEETYQANNGQMFLFGTENLDTQLGMEAGTSPSIAALPNGGYETAFQANNGDLLIYGADGNADLGLGMKVGTSPSITATLSDGYEIAFQANTGHLLLYGSQKLDTDLGMEAGTSPSIAALPNGGYEIAFQANNGDLLIYGADGNADLNLGMETGTSPSLVATPSSGYEIAFQANTGQLFLYGSESLNTQLGMEAGTSPSLTYLPGGGYEVAFHANNGDLLDYGADQSTDTEQGMLTGTSPAIAALSNGEFQIVFQANGGQLYTYTYPSPGPAANNLGMEAGTSPAIAP